MIHKEKKKPKIIKKTDLLTKVGKVLGFVLFGFRSVGCFCLVLVFLFGLLLVLWVFVRLGLFVFNGVVILEKCKSFFCAIRLLSTPEMIRIFLQFSKNPVSSKFFTLGHLILTCTAAIIIP